MNLKRMVCGFAFTEDLQWVLLVNKLKPKWQKGHWNGIGGKVETQEDPLAAMVREFQEETGLYTTCSEWKHTIKLFVLDNGAVVYFYRTTMASSALEPLMGQFDGVGEELGLRHVANPTTHWIPNLRWLIPIQNAPLEFPLLIQELYKGGFQK